MSEISQHKVSSPAMGMGSRRSKVPRKFGSQKARGASKKQAYPPTRVLYVRGFPSIASDADILAVFKQLVETSDIFVLPNSNEAFIDVKTKEKAIECVKHFQKSPTTIRGHEIQVSYSGREEITTSRTNKDQPSAVLLVTMCNVKILFSPDQLKEIFEEYGSVLRIINFVKEKYGLQSLVEMESSEVAVEAKAKVDGKSFYGSFNIIKVQHSDLPTLDIEKTSYNCRDYTLEDDSLNQAGSNGVSSKFTNYGQDPMASYGHPGMGMPGNPYAMYMNDAYNYSPEMMMGSANALGVNMMRMANQLEIYNTMMMNSMQAAGGQAFELSGNGSPRKSLPWKKRRGVGITSVLNVTGLSEGFTHEMLFNLFGLFGRVARVRCRSDFRSDASVEFFEPEEAAHAREQLNFLNLQGNTLQIYFSKTERAIEDYFTYNGREGFTTQEFYESHAQRSTGSRSRDSDAAREGPSSELLIRNISEEAKNFLLHDIALYALVKESTVGPEQDTLLVKMETAGDAAVALARFHQAIYAERILDVSFWNFQDPTS